MSSTNQCHNLMKPFTDKKQTDGWREEYNIYPFRYSYIGGNNKKAETDIFFITFERYATLPKGFPNIILGRK